MRISTTSFPDIKLFKKKRNNLINKAVTITSFISMNYRQIFDSGKREIDWKEGDQVVEFGRNQGSERAREGGREGASDAGVARTSPPLRRVRVTGVVSPGAWKYY
jgi:hypothetical protein